MAYLTKDQVKKMIGDLSNEHSPEDVVNSLIKQGHTLEGFDEQPEQAGNFEQLATGFAKGAGRSAISLIESAPTIQKIINPMQAITNKITGGKTLLERGVETASQLEPVVKTKEFLEPKTQLEKVGGHAETATEILVPSVLAGKAVKMLGRAEKALSLSNKELQKLGGKSLQYLSKKAIAKAPLKGVLGEKTPAMVDKVKSLANEFKDILVHQNPEKNRLAAEKLGKEYAQKSLKLFEGRESAVNLKTFKSLFEKAIKQDTKNVYGVEAKEITDKALRGFLNKVEKGTNKGLEKARIAWRAEAMNTEGKISKANEVLHNLIKKTIKETLPEEQKILYDAYKTKMAKLFDVQTIAEAKKAALRGTSLLKNVAKKSAIIGGIAAGADVIRRALK